jgi:threonine dehydratase
MMVSFGDIQRAAEAIRGAVLDTPFAHSRLLSELSGAQVHLKMENLQYTGSFKERGALVKLLSLDADERRRGVIAMSAGNHALGVAHHAQRLGIPATIVMPRGTPFVKVANTRHHGARVILHGNGLAEAAAHALDMAAAEGLVFVHPYNDPLIIAGQGTVALDMLARVPDLDVIVVPVGGGGLIAGCAIAAKHIRPDIQIVGVESDRFASVIHALRGGPAIAGGKTIAEGIAVENPGTLTCEIIDRFVDDLVTVTEDDIEAAVQMLVEIEKTVAEGAGAAAVACVFAHKQMFSGKRVGLLICGGNIDMRLLASVLMRGLVRAGRLTLIRVCVGDAPGELAKVANLIGEADGNIVEITHQRLFHHLSIKMAELDVVIETRGPAHVHDIVERLTAAGFAPEVMSDKPRGATIPRPA